MTEDMQVRNLSPHTQDSYVQQISLFARHFSKSPEILGPEEIRSYQLYLTNEKKLAPSSILIFIDTCTNVIFAGPTGIGKSHLAIALGYAACLRGHSVLFAAAIDVVNRLSAAESSRQLAREIKHYQSPRLLLIDELGYLPLDKRGAELLFQVITKRYERGSIIITTNIAFKDWPRIFAGDATMTSALLDRLLHHAQPVLIEGDSYRSAKRKNVSSER